MDSTAWQGLNASFVADGMQRLNGAAFAREHELRGLTALTGRVAIGPAYTVRVRAARNPAGNERQRWFDAIDQAPKGSVFVIQANDDVGAAVFGEMVALRLHTLGVAGAVVDGYSRDIQQIRDIGLAYWTRTITMRGMIPDEADTETGVVLDIGGTTIRPGDLVAADADGVVVCPQAAAEQALGIARTFRDSEVVTERELRKGARLLDVYPSKTSIPLAGGKRD
ncbi:MAG: RraA family protein [Lautropia sp.]